MVFHFLISIFKTSVSFSLFRAATLWTWEKIIEVNLSKVNVTGVLEDIQQLSLSEQYTIYTTLLKKLKCEEKTLIEYCQNVHSLDYLKGLLNVKKEVAINRMITILPLLKTRNVEAKSLILKVLPVLLSYVSLYDTEIDQVFKIIETIRVHPAFSQDLGLFEQWFEVFERRRKSEKKFQYKDETFFYDLPPLTVDSHCTFSMCTGYADVSLLRTVHRWLRILRLHKYLYFFANLTYGEIISINCNNIHYYERTVGVFDMTQGARNKILREIEDLRSRPARLKSIIERTHFSSEVLENAIRDLKKVMRSPISAVAETQLINQLLDTLSKISHTMHSLIGTSEKVIPLYGLTLSILKEAYNYSYFSPKQKENFNVMRLRLAAKINLTSSKSVATSCPISIVSASAEYKHDDNEDEYDDDTCSSTLSLSPIDSTELIAIQMANFVLLD